MNKICAEVIAHFNLDGEIIPLKIKMNIDGEERAYCIDKPSKPVKGASLTIGVQGYKYSCVIEGMRACLYQDYTNKWYIEM